MPTIWEARKAGWTVGLRCHRQREGLKSVKPCAGELTVHLGTLIAVLGLDVPLADLQGRLRCPACGTDRVEIRTVQPPRKTAGALDQSVVLRRRMRPAQRPDKLGTTPERWIVFDCPKCGRRGEYRKENLVAEFGTEIDMPSFLAVFAHSRGCGLAIPQPTQGDLAQQRECLIRYDVDPNA